MGSVGADYKCPLCNRTGNGSYCLDDVGYPTCTGTNEQYKQPDCRSLLLANPTKKPSHIAQEATGLALEKVLGDKLTKRLSYDVIANQIVPWLLDLVSFDVNKLAAIKLEISKARLSLYTHDLPSRVRLQEAYKEAMKKARTPQESEKMTEAFFQIIQRFCEKGCNQTATNSRNDSPTMHPM